MTILTAGEPLESMRCAVGRTTSVFVDSTRDDRTLGIDCWYPASAAAGDASVYELLPGVGFTAHALADAPAALGAHPLLIWSHGRGGTRSSYALLCEGLAARGYVIVAPDHPGDTLADWLLGSAVDDGTNERQRVDDMRCMLDAVLGRRDGLALAPVIDTGRIAVAGHSYGAYTALACAGSEPADTRIRAVAGLQALTRSLPDAALARIAAPVLFVVACLDTNTPVAIDADPAWNVLGAGPDPTRVDVEYAGHQACSDVGLYLDLLPQVDGLPELVTDFVQSKAADVTGRAGDPWRPTVALHLRLLGAWLDDVLDRDRDHARHELEAVGALPGVMVR